MNSKFLGLVAVVGAAAAAQPVMIDDFSTGTYSLVANSANPNREAVRLGLMLGFQRDALLQYMGGPLTVSSSVGSGAVQFFNSDSQTQGALTLQYDGIDFEIENGVLNNDNNLNVNLSNSNAFKFDFRFVDPGLATSMTVTTSVLASNGLFTHTMTIPEGTNFSVLQSFANFGGANFSHVRRLDFKFSGPAATDFTLDAISTVENVIPGPAAIGAFLIGLAPRLRRRKA